VDLVEAEVVGVLYFSSKDLVVAIENRVIDAFVLAGDLMQRLQGCAQIMHRYSAAASAVIVLGRYLVRLVALKDILFRGKLDQPQLDRLIELSNRMILACLWRCMRLGGQLDLQKSLDSV